MVMTMVTATARELVASMLAGTDMWAVLHTSEPVPNDPQASIVRTTGALSVKVAWKLDGASMTNSMPLQFPGISDLGSVNWIALCTDRDGYGILFAGPVEEPQSSGAGFDIFVVPAETITLSVM